MGQVMLDNNNNSSNDEKLRNIYKKIKFKPKDTSNKSEWDEFKTKEKQSKSVSFNTVPSILGTSSYEDNFEGLKLPTSLDNSIINKSNNNLNSLSFHSYNNIDKLFIITPEGKIVRKDYPSRPTIINDAMIINKFYLDWMKRWQNHKLQIEERLNNKTQWFKYPEIIYPSKKVKPILMDEDYVPLTKNQRRKKIVLTTKTPSVNLPRTIICHINGRKHTWVALDWLLSISLHDMDHLIILTNIPRVKMCQKINQDEDTFWGDSLIYEQSYILEIVHNILSYIHLLLSKHNKSVKVTIDMVIGKTKKVFIDAINLYTPDLIIVPTLKWERNAKLIEHKSTYLKDNLCINFPIPVCIVPARRLYQFELNLQERINNHKQIDSSQNDIAVVNDNENELILHSPLSSSNSSLSSINSFTADYNSEMTTISDTFSTSCKEKDNKYKDQFDTLNDEQFLLDIQDLPIVSQLYLVARRCRRHMQEEIGQLEIAKPHLSTSQYLVGKLDCVLKTSLEGSLMINNIKGNKLSNDVDLKGFARLKRVITGGEPTYLPSPKPMTDVSGYKSPRNKLSPLRHSTIISSPKKGSSQIMFASDVKIQDGKKALGNWRTNKSSSSNFNSPPTSPKLPTIIKRIPSTEAIRSIHSNDSEKSAMSITSDYLSPKRLPVFNPGTKKSASTPSSRRNSNSSDKSQVSFSGGKRKMISKLFGFK